MPYPGVIPAGATMAYGGAPALLTPSAVPSFDSLIIAGSLAPAPTNYYPMNEASGTTVVDAMGNANGTYHGSPFLLQQKLLIPDGKPVPYFAAVTPNYAILNDPTTSATPFTIMVAFANGASQISSAVIMSDYDTNASYFDFYVDANNNMYRGVNGAQVQLTTQSPIGDIHLAFMVYDGANFKVYVDSGQVNSVAGAYSKRTLGWQMGAHNSGSAPWNGWAGKAGIWGSTALSQAQVTAITNAFFGSTVTAIVNPSTGGGPAASSSYLSAVFSNANLTNFWKCSDLSGTVLTDSKGSNNGTLVNSPTLGLPSVLASGTDPTILVGGNTTFASCPYITLPAAAFPDADYTFEFIGYTQGNSVAAFFDSTNSSNVNGVAYSFCGTSTGNVADALNYPGVTTDTAPGTRGLVHFTYTYKKSSTTNTWYVNGTASGPARSRTNNLAATNGVAIGANPFDSGGAPGNLRVQYIARYGATFTPAQVQANFQALNLFR